MNTKTLERFAQAARRQLHEQVAAKLQRVLHTDSAELRGQAAALHKLQSAVAETSRAAVIERVAYIWFNRFCALRYMDVNHYTAIGVVSPQEGFTQPALLQEAKQGHIDDDLAPFVERQRVFDLLARRQPSQNPEQEAYRLLLIGVCNYYHDIMPFLFERIDDYTQLLIPDDLLSENSILQAMRDAMTPEACQDVEVIGWLYQFYISEKKTEVDLKVKAGGTVAVDELPAKTSLYTKDWIVRFLVENSLGRLWLLNRPNSRLVERMAYYIMPDSPETEFLRVNSPEEIKLCDPAPGSGHILTYAFDLLYAIYEEEGYNPPDIPRLILEKNLYGMEIDERAGALAAFALVMKARAKDRRFLVRGVRPHIFVLQKITFAEGELKGEAWIQESGSAKEALLHDLHLFADADNFGSLLRPQLSAQQITALRWHMEAKQSKGQVNWLEQDRRDKIARALAQAEVLADTYHVVVANPPYLGKGMNNDLKQFADRNYPDSKSDLFAMFIERGLELALPNGYNAMITMESWMFLSSYKKLREKLLSKSTINSMVHMPYLGKGGTPLGINFGTAATVFSNHYHAHYEGHYSCVRYYETDDDYNPFEFPVKNERLARAAAADFKKIPGSPIAYWIPTSLFGIFENQPSMVRFLEPREGMATGDNDTYIRLWWEVSLSEIAQGCASRADALVSGRTWFPYNKGGEFRKWAGNDEYIVNWYQDGNKLQTTLHPSGSRIWAHNFNLDYIFRSFITWSDITTKGLSVRVFRKGYLFDATGLSAFDRLDSKFEFQYAMGICNSKVGFYIATILNPSMHFKSGDFAELPVVLVDDEQDDIIQRVNTAINLATEDWDSFETSRDFSRTALLRIEAPAAQVNDAYHNRRIYWRDMTMKLRDLEQVNNRIFTEAYSLQVQLSSEVPLEEITLICNPHYRYGGNKNEAELEELLRADTMREFISYAVGCMFGRYSLDKPGLILANQGETLDDYLRQVPQPTFMPDKDNVIPILDGEWFTDDIVARFNRFLRVTFGESHFQENLAFIEQAIGRDLRSYFLRDFYDHHLKMYQKRPIYWLFSSPKGSFNALIYMHRYRPDTVSVVLNNYLRDYRTKLVGHRAHQGQLSISASAASRDKTRALKEIDRIDKVLRELTDYENDILYPLATQQVQIDLDDGVKVNYNKFGSALKKVTGMSE